MSDKPMSETERRLYEAGGFRFDRPARSARDLQRTELDATIAVLRAWQCSTRNIKAALAILSARVLGRWRRGEQLIGWRARERVAIILALSHRLSEAGDVVWLHPLPDLKRHGKRRLPAREVLASGRLRDLIGLWRQVVRAEEAAERRQQLRKRQKRK